MKLREFNAENTRNTRSGSPAIGVNQKTGIFNCNKLAAEKLHLKNNDQVAFHQDEDAPENWYIEKVKTGGFVVRTKDEGPILFNNSALARQIGEALSISGSYRMLVAGEPTKVEKRNLYGLLIRSN